VLDPPRSGPAGCPINRAGGRLNGARPSSVRLVAISKTFTADHIRAAADCGQVDFGENKVQEALPKMERTGDLPFAGILSAPQSNKARKAAVFDVVHSVDSAALAARLDEAAAASMRRLDWLSGGSRGQATKHGASAPTW
jgi:uncharacterized pyridoxal phosphate-containing UPF0001 family protein